MNFVFCERRKTFNLYADVLLLESSSPCDFTNDPTQALHSSLTVPSHQHTSLSLSLPSIPSRSHRCPQVAAGFSAATDSSRQIRLTRSKVPEPAPSLGLSPFRAPHINEQTGLSLKTPFLASNSSRCFQKDIEVAITPRHTCTRLQFQEVKVFEYF